MRRLRVDVAELTFEHRVRDDQRAHRVDGISTARRDGLADGDLELRGVVGLLSAGSAMESFVM
jgi:hypothetical protein